MKMILINQTEHKLLLEVRSKNSTGIDEISVDAGIGIVNPAKPVIIDEHWDQVEIRIVDPEQDSEKKPWCLSDYICVDGLCPHCNKDLGIDETIALPLIKMFIKKIKERTKETDEPTQSVYEIIDELAGEKLTEEKK